MAQFGVDVLMVLLSNGMGRGTGCTRFSIIIMLFSVFVLLGPGYGWVMSVGWFKYWSLMVLLLEVGGGYVFTLANHGGIRGWNILSPGSIDNALRSELASREMLYTKLENIKVLAGTWNVGQERASPDSLISWLGSAATEVGIVVVGLQEVEMGAGFLAMAVAKETVGLEGSANGQWWLDAIGKTLDEGNSFERVGSRQLAGLLIAVWWFSMIIYADGSIKKLGTTQPLIKAWHEMCDL